MLFYFCTIYYHPLIIFSSNCMYNIQKYTLFQTIGSFIQERGIELWSKSTIMLSTNSFNTFLSSSMRGYLSGLGTFMSQFIPVKSYVNAGEYSGLTGPSKQPTFKVVGTQQNQAYPTMSPTECFQTKQETFLWEGCPKFL